MCMPYGLRPYVLTPCNDRLSSAAHTILRVLLLAGMLQEAEEAFEGNAMTMEMLEKLQQLPWRRIDADFSATSMPFFAHNLIQVLWREPRPDRSDCASKCSFVGLLPVTQWALLCCCTSSHAAA